MTEARTPLNFRLRFITEAGQFNRPAIDNAIDAKALTTYARSDAHSYIWSEARGEMALYEMRVLTRTAGYQTVADQVHGYRRPAPSLIAAE